MVRSIYLLILGLIFFLLFSFFLILIIPRISLHESLPEVFAKELNKKGIFVQGKSIFHSDSKNDPNQLKNIKIDFFFHKKLDKANSTKKIDAILQNKHLLWKHTINLPKNSKNFQIKTNQIPKTIQRKMARENQIVLIMLATANYFSKQIKFLSIRVIEYKKAQTRDLKSVKFVFHRQFPTPANSSYLIKGKYRVQIYHFSHIFPKDKHFQIAGFADYQKKRLLFQHPIQRGPQYGYFAIKRKNTFEPAYNGLLWLISVPCPVSATQSNPCINQKIAKGEYRYFGHLRKRQLETNLIDVRMGIESILFEDLDYEHDLVLYLGEFLKP